MAMIIVLMIAFWHLQLPLSLQVLMTVFGSLSCLCRFIKIIVDTAKKYHEQETAQRKTGIDLLDRFIK